MSGSKQGERRGGRQKGTPNKKTIEKEQRAVEAMAALAASVGPDVAGIGRVSASEAPQEARAGITPKDLLLTSMRNAWEVAHVKSAQADALEAQAARVEAEIADLHGPELAPEVIEQIRAKAETLEGLRKRVSALRGEAGALTAHATGLAKDVAPYMHPKLAAVDGKSVGDIIVKIRQF